MTKKKGKLIVNLLLCMMLLVSTLLIESVPVYSAVDDEQLNRSSLTLIVNESKQFGSYYGDAILRVFNSTGAPTFKSSNPKIATVGTDGVITAVKAGKCTVSAKIGKKTYKCKVTVKNAYSKKSLQKNLKLLAKTKNGVVTYKVVNKYKHPMYIDIIGKEIKADGSNSMVSLEFPVPGSATTYVYENLSAPTSNFIFVKRTFSYTNNGGVGRCIADNKYMAYMYSQSDYLTYNSSKCGFDIDSVSVEPNLKSYESGVKVNISGNFHNYTPMKINSRITMACSYILFYKKGELVQSVKVDYTSIPYSYTGSGKITLDNVCAQKISNWDGDYDEYKIVTNPKTLVPVNKW